MTARNYQDGLTSDVNAFALGARLVNPRAEVMNYLLQEPDNYHEQNNACYEFSRFGADVALVQQSFSNPLSRKAFPGIFAQLYLLHHKYGYPDECLGAASCDWFVFYGRVVEGIFSGEGTFAGSGAGGESIHFGWGINTGLVDVYGTAKRKNS